MTNEQDAAKAAGVRRLNKKPLLIVMLALILVVAAVANAIAQRGRDQKKAAKAKPEDHTSIVDTHSSVLALTKDAPNGLIPDKTDPPADPAQPPPIVAKTDSAQVSDGVGSKDKHKPAPDGATKDVSLVPDKAVTAFGKEEDEDREERKRKRRMKEQLYEAALSASTTVNTFKPTSDSSQRANAQPHMVPTSANSAASGMTDMINSRIAALANSVAGGAEADPNNQKGKQDFLDKENTGKFGYLVASRQAAISPYEIKAGTVIPAVLITGINSDLPGMIVGQVSQNVYDTATGKYLLIPQGTRVVGSYDSVITYGQSRALVAWNKLTFPDTSSIFVGSMGGADQGGYSGFKDKVNNHYIRTFGSALLLSLFSAGVQLSQPNSNTTLRPSAQEELTAEVGREMGQVGSEVIKRNLNIQPTIEIRPGYRFNVMVNKDMILQPYTPLVPRLETAAN